MKGARQTVQLHRLVCTFDVCIQQNKFFPAQAQFIYSSSAALLIGSSLFTINYAAKLINNHSCHTRKSN